MENKLYTFWFAFCSLFYFSYIVLCITSYYLNVVDSTGFIDFRYDRIITLISLSYFILLLISSFHSQKVFWFLLPIVIITVPNAVNSIFPGFYLTHLNERGNASFSFISHIDIYLLFQFLLILVKGEKFELPKDKSFNLLYVLICLLVITLLYKSTEVVYNGGDLIYVLNGAFHFRYLFLVLLLSFQLKVCENEQAFFYGILLSVPILFLEGLVTSVLNGADLMGSFQSGNFANNVFGNFLVFLFVYLLSLDSSFFKVHLFVRACLLLLLVSILMTGVRGALLSLIFGLISYYLLIRMSVNLILGYFLFILLIVITTFYYFDLFFLFDYTKDLFFSFQLVIENGFGSKGIRIDENNSSLITRFALWSGTFQMAIDNWFFGVGSSQWNFLKGQYGIPFGVLLDPHNDYLNFFALYGVGGLLFVFIIYVRPMLYVVFNKLSGKVNPYNLSLFALSISSLTNANNTKHQVFAMVSVFLVLSVWHERKIISRNLNFKKI